MSLRLSPKHGVAPALTFCRLCGKETQELALLGLSSNKVLRDLYDATDGKYGNKEGYQEYGHNKIPAQEPCDECKSYLVGGCIIIAKDTGEYLRLTKDMTDTLVGRVADAKGRFIDFDAMRGKIINIRLRDPKEWTE